MNAIGDAAALGEALQRARYAAGLTQREVAGRLGISQLYVSEMEAGKPSLFTERLFGFLREVGAVLAIEAAVPGEVHGYRPVWPRAAREDDAAALHGLDPAVPVERFAAWIADPGTEIVTIDGAVDWPSGTHMQARRAFAGEKVLLGYAVDGRVVVRAGYEATDVGALLLGKVR